MFQVRRITPAELAAVQRLRAEVHGAEKLEDPSRFTADGRLVDSNDAWSINIGAFATADDRLVGCAKVTPRSAERPLKLEADVPAATLGIDPGLPCVEWARLVVLPAYRALGVMLGLYRVAYWITLAGGYESIYAIQREAPLRTQERLGLPVVRLSGRLLAQNGVLVTPTCTSVAEIMPALRRSNPPLAYFLSRLPADGGFEPRDLLGPPMEDLRAFMGGSVPMPATR